MAPFLIVLQNTVGLATIQQRRGQQTDKPLLLTGPGKVYAFQYQVLYSASSLFPHN